MLQAAFFMAFVSDLFALVYVMCRIAARSAEALFLVITLSMHIMKTRLKRIFNEEMARHAARVHVHREALDYVGAALVALEVAMPIVEPEPGDPLAIPPIAAACLHLRTTRRGSNMYFTRVSCKDCKQVLQRVAVRALG